MSDECDCPPPGLPAWMGTFADLMSLLMCFFVLLLSFSEMDVVKFKQIAGSMQYAFGVQNQIEVKNIPKGTTVIAQEFRPGRPDPTPIETIMQHTIDSSEAELDFKDGEDQNAGGKNKLAEDSNGGKSPETSTRDNTPTQNVEVTEDTSELVKVLAEALKEEIDSGGVEVENLGQQIIIRINEKGSFPSGSAFLQPRFRPVIQKIAQLLATIPGIITIAGHTGKEQLYSELYRSKWDLSSQRAVSVAHEMLKVEEFTENRLIVQGMADTQPLTDDENELRRNRRVEISIMQGKAKLSAPISVMADN
ncbi:flagellar motor protein MotB [Moritella sp.]|uniref:flagellar motor protein MotB n=1 Tax=Moritella sp. TaxID=78556 RepID=UPI001D579379|nr:flagellar motor protein MotB [Moritella sp.]MCJ8348006.1 flagellar motor protein MotB [Moritella sp.]NQZ40321.1 flagellar motor protein MotB [Moritella sp.]